MKEREKEREGQGKEKPIEKTTRANHKPHRLAAAVLHLLGFDLEHDADGGHDKLDGLRRVLHALHHRDVGGLQGVQRLHGLWGRRGRKGTLFSSFTLGIGGKLQVLGGGVCFSFLA